MNTIAIIDYGMGNLHSVSKAFEHVAPDASVIVTSDAEKIRNADKVVLPGVGAMRDCMAEMKRLNVDELVKEVSVDRPFLGICVGMQALLERSEENDGVDSIGLFPGHVLHFGDELKENGRRLKVPHMGWNKLNIAVDSWLDQSLNDAFVYFVHSYYVELGAYTVASTNYIKPFSAVLQKDNFFATQFHPEKSGSVGAEVLNNFLNNN